MCKIIDKLKNKAYNGHIINQGGDTNVPWISSYQKQILSAGRINSPAAGTRDYIPSAPGRAGKHNGINY